MLGGVVAPAMDYGSSRLKSRSTTTNQSPSGALPDGPVDPVVRTAVSLEYASVRYKEHCPLGIYIIPSSESLMIWDAVFFVHQGG